MAFLEKRYIFGGQEEEKKDSGAKGRQERERGNNAYIRLWRIGFREIDHGSQIRWTLSSFYAGTYGRWFSGNRSIT